MSQELIYHNITSLSLHFTLAETTSKDNTSTGPDQIKMFLQPLGMKLAFR